MLLTLCALPILAGPIQTPTHEVVYSQIASSSTSVIPGIPGAFFQNFYEVRVSPSGNHWALTGTRNSSSSFNDLTIVDGQLLFLQSFGTMPWDNTQSWAAGWIDVNDSGGLLVASEQSHAAGAAHLVHSPDLGANWNILLTEGDSVTGVSGGTYQKWLDPRLTASGLAGHRGELIGTPTSEDESQHFNGLLLQQKGVTIPAGQTGSLPIQALDFHEYGLEVSDDGSHWMTRAFIGPAGGAFSERVVIYDGSVVLETDTTIPGAGFTRPIDHIDGAHMTPGGTWYAWGRNEASTYRDWVVKEGVVIAQEDQPIIPGHPENWDSLSNLAAAFTFARGSANGDSLVYGSTSGTTNWALVRNGTDIVLKWNEPIDLDGNGLFDDDTFIVSISELSDWAGNGDLWAVCNLQNSSFAQLGKALIRFNIDFGGPGVPFCSPADFNSTGVPTNLIASLGSGVGSGLHLEVADGPPNQFGYFLVGTAFSEPGTPVSNGHLCVSGNLGRFNFTGTERNSVGQINSAGVCINLVGTATSTGGTGYDVPVIMPMSGSPSITPGSTWNFQFWHRESGGLANFSNGLSVTF